MYKSIIKRCASLVAALLFSSPIMAQVDYEVDRTVKESRIGIIRNTLLTIDDDAKAIINRPLKTKYFCQWGQALRDDRDRLPND